MAAVLAKDREKTANLTISCELIRIKRYYIILSNMYFHKNQDDISGVLLLLP